MNPTENNSSKKKTRIIIAILFVVILVIGISFIVSREDMHEIAPGSEELPEPILIAGTSSESINAAIDSNAVEMPSVPTPQTESKSVGTIETADGEYEIIGLKN